MWKGVWLPQSSIGIRKGRFRLEYREGNDGNREKATGVASIANNAVV